MTKLAKEIVFENDGNIVIDGVSLPFYVGEDIKIETLHNSGSDDKETNPDLLGVTVTIFVERVVGDHEEIKAAGYRKIKEAWDEVKSEESNSTRKKVEYAIGYGIGLVAQVYVLAKIFKFINK